MKNTPNAPVARRKRGEIEVHVVASTEAIDLESWVEQYVRAVFEAKGYTLPAELAA